MKVFRVCVCDVNLVSRYFDLTEKELGFQLGVLLRSGLFIYSIEEVVDGCDS